MTSLLDLDWLLRNATEIAELSVQHLYLSLAPLLIGVVIALPLGWAAQRSRLLNPVLVGASSLLYTVPSLALFVLLPSVLGTQILDPLNVVIALSVYTVALMVRVVADGLNSVPQDTVQAATAMGYRASQRLLLVELPVAVPVITAGLRVALVSNVSLVSVAALLGIPQLGSLFTQGFQRQFFTPVIVGVVLSAVLALVLDALVVAAERVTTPWVPRGVTS